MVIAMLVAIDTVFLGRVFQPSVTVVDAFAGMAFETVCYFRWGMRCRVRVGDAHANQQREDEMVKMNVLTHWQPRLYRF